MKRPSPPSRTIAPETARQNSHKPDRDATNGGSREPDFSVENFVGAEGETHPPLTREEAFARVGAAAARYGLSSIQHLRSHGDPHAEAAGGMVGGQGKTSISLDKLLSETLAGLDYRRVGALAYRATWSTDEVEHFLSFGAYGTPRVYLIGDVGLKNRDAELFAIGCLRKYGGAVYRQLDAKPPPWKCFMHFSLGMLAGWGPRSSLTMTHMSERRLSGAIAAAVRDCLRPYIGSVTTSARLLEFLLRDEQPMIWVRTNAAARIAEIVWLARRQGESGRAIEKMVEPHLGGNIGASLGRDSLPPAEFVARVIEDSAKVAER